jgi:hypothetical protein
MRASLSVVTFVTQHRGRIGFFGSIAPAGMEGGGSPALRAFSTERSQNFLSTRAEARSVSYFSSAACAPLAFSRSAAMTAACT